MQLDLKPENIAMHETLLAQLISNLEREHLEYVLKMGLDIKIEPQKSEY